MNDLKAHLAAESPGAARLIGVAHCTAKVIDPVWLLDASMLITSRALCAALASDCSSEGK